MKNFGVPARCGTFLLASAILQAHAQYAPANQTSRERYKAEIQKQQDELQSFVGRKYWLIPNPHAQKHVEFSELVDGAPVGPKFIVTEPASFEILSFVPGSLHRPMVQFTDGKQALMDLPVIHPAGDKRLFNYQEIAPGEEDPDDIEDHFHTAPPEAYIAAARKKKAKQVAAAAALKARGGVSIGMTAEQVRKSSWGKPRSINRTIGSFGVHEQWVYGGGNYIYLENGNVTAIQN